MLRTSLLLGLFAAAAPAFAQQYVVTEAGSAIPGATVRFQDAAGADRAVATSATGGFSLPEGAGEVRISAIGYEALAFNPDTLPAGPLELQPAVFALSAAVVTGQYGLRGDHEVVQPVQIIDRRTIDRIGALTLRDALQTQSSLALGHDAQLGTQVNLLGLSGRHVQVLVDGLPVLGRLDGNIDLDQLPLDRVARVEIVEGPMSVEYGSEAIAGTINLITEEQPATSVRAAAESIGRFTTSAQFARGPWTGRISRLYFGGAGADTSRSVLWKPKEQLTASVGGSWSVGDVRVRASGEVMDETLWNDGSVNYVQQSVAVNDTLLEVLAMPRANDLVFGTRRSIGRVDVAGDEVQGFVAFNRYRRDRLSYGNDLTREDGLTLLPDDSDTTFFTTLHTRWTGARLLSEGLHGSAGLEASVEQGRGERIGQVGMTQAAVFGSVEWARGAWTVRPGLRWAYNSAFGAPLIPSLHAKWSNGPHAVRASYARGFRAPDLKELHFLFVDFNHNIQGSTDLQPELSHSYQLGYTHRQLRESALLEWNVRSFHNDVRSLIELAQVNAETQLYTYVNVGRVRATGASAKARWEGERTAVKGEVTAVRRVRDLAQEQVVGQTLQAALSADHRLTPRLRLALQVNHAHRETMLTTAADGSLTQLELSPFTNLATYLSHHTPHLTLRAGVDNLLGVTARLGSLPTDGGVHSSSATSQPMSVGRNFRFTLAYTMP